MTWSMTTFIRVKLKVALNEKRKKLLGFSFSINIANFEAFLKVKKLSTILFFLKSEIFFNEIIIFKIDRSEHFFLVW